MSVELLEPWPEERQELLVLPPVTGDVVVQQPTMMFVPIGNMVQTPPSIPITIGQVSALAMLTLTGIIVSSGELMTILFLPIGMLLSLPGALYAKVKKNDYFMETGVYPPTHTTTWISLLICIVVCVAAVTTPIL